jgi:hypothetical protein
MFIATNVQPNQLEEKEDQVCWIIHLSFLCYQINFLFESENFFSILFKENMLVLSY